MRRVKPPVLSKSAATAARHGIATVWIIASVPAIFTLLILLTDIGSLWQARTELETALESAALAAVQEWKATNDTNSARIAAQNFSKANTVLGNPVILTNNGGGGGTNDNSKCDGDIVLGNITSAGDFEASVAPNSTNFYGARIRNTKQIPSLWIKFAGVSFGPYVVHAEAVAELQFNAGGTPRLMRPHSFTCP
jgi:Flp pilus assembly protein TadG